MIAMAPEADERVDEDLPPRLQWLRDQQKYLADEEAECRLMNGLPRRPPEDCPWCRRFRELGFVDIACPVCAQLGRSQGALDELGPRVRLTEPVYRPDHHGSAEVTITVNYQVGPTRRQAGKIHGLGPERREWHCRLTMQAGTEDVDAFFAELATRGKREARAKPFLGPR